MDKLKAVYENMEEVPELYRDLFELRGGKATLTQIEGIDTQGNVHRLTTTLEQIKKKNSDLVKKIEAFGDATPEKFTELTDKVTELEALVEAGGKPDEEKTNKLVEARLKAKLGPVERDLKISHDKLKEAEDRAATLQSKLTNMKINLAVRAAATKANVVPTAVEDVLALAGGVFEIIESDGKEKIVTRDGIGMTPGLEADDYFSEMAPKKPHWFPGSAGAGARGGGGGIPGNGKNPWLAKHWNLTDQMNYVKEHGSEKAKLAAQAANSYLGATGPAKEK